MDGPRPLYFTRAMYEGLQEALREDPTVVVIGEDVERGVIGTTTGLIDEFGPMRVRNTPISEAVVAGACVGAAAVGLRPVVDLMFASFFYVAMDQVANQAAKLPYMSGGQVRLPIVYLAGGGASGSAAAQHSESPHPLLMNVGGLKVVIPSSPADAKGLMISAIRDDDPVVYLYDLALASMKADVPAGPHAVPIGVADVKRCGSDVTVVAIGALVNEALDVADELAENGVSLEVIDPRSLVPLDEPTILESVRKTGRLVVCDSAKLTCSAASEIAAMVAERAFGDLRSPVARVASGNVPMPFSPPLEERVAAAADDIRKAVFRTLTFDAVRGAV